MFETLYQLTLIIFMTTPAGSVDVETISLGPVATSFDSCKVQALGAVTTATDVSVLSAKPQVTFTCTPIATPSR